MSQAPFIARPIPATTTAPAATPTPFTALVKPLPKPVPALPPALEASFSTPPIAFLMSGAIFEVSGKMLT